MYLSSQYKLNHGNQIKSPPHGSKPLSPQNTKEEKSKEWEKKPHIPKNQESPMHTPRNPSNLLKIKTKTPQSSPSNTPPLPGNQPQAPSP